MRKLPKVCAQNILFELKYKVHKHGIITPSILFKAKRYQVKSNTMMTTKNGDLNEMRKLPKVRAKIGMFAFEYILHNMESSLPQYHLKCNHLHETTEKKLRLALASKKWLCNK
jgi:hypothetical protein